MQNVKIFHYIEMYSVYTLLAIFPMCKSLALTFPGAFGRNVRWQ